MENGSKSDCYRTYRCKSIRSPFFRTNMSTYECTFRKYSILMNCDSNIIHSHQAMTVYLHTEIVE